MLWILVLPSYPSAYCNTAWETCQASDDQCLLNWTNPQDHAAFLPYNRVCSQGSIARYFVDIRTPQDAILAFNFVRNTTVRTFIKNTGHDYSGRSSAPDSLGLWVHNLKDKSFNSEFVADGCASDDSFMAITFGVGVRTRELYNFADQHQVVVFGASDSSVAAGGGYLMGGGHGIFSNAFGLAVDQVLQFEIVTPEGQHLKVNKCQNQDLFWALRGGGGGTFGLTLSVTMKAFKAFDFVMVRTAFNSTPSMEGQRRYTDFLVDTAYSWATDGWGAVIVPNLGLVMVNPFLSLEDVIKVTKPLQDLVHSLNGSFIIQEEHSFVDFYDTFIEPTNFIVGAPSALGSRLIPNEVFRDEVRKVQFMDAIGNISAAQHDILLLFAVPPLHFQQKEEGATSINPIWRTSVWHVFFVDYWNYDTTIDERNSIYSKLHSSAQRLRDVTPDGGTYLNEAEVHEPNYQDAFWGGNYDGLLKVKKKYDPKHLLDCWRCVGWQGEDDRYSCYP